MRVLDERRWMSLAAAAVLAACGAGDAAVDGPGTPEGPGSEVDGAGGGGPGPGAEADAGGAGDDGAGGAVQHCDAFTAERRVLFGDLHVHTSYSGDAYERFGNVKLDPDDAYGFAKGAQVDTTVDPSRPRTFRLHRPLDFAAITDHSEGLGVAAGVSANAWEREQAAAAKNLDATRACSFTTFVAYEWTGVPPGSAEPTTGVDQFPTWWHRNVIFANDKVPAYPLNSRAPDSNTPEKLHAALKTKCTQAGSGCDVIVIPHNTNYSRGYSLGIEANITAAEAEERARFEPLVEMYQAKGSSECVPGLDNDDPFCAFELLHDYPLCPTDAPNQVGCESRSSYVRTALVNGLAAEKRIGKNPLKLGFVASTDQHNSTPGATDEDNFQGHMWQFDDQPLERLQVDPQDISRSKLKQGAGGLTAVWAEENSRDAIFAALRRRETYGTSGTRMQVRVFGGWGYTPAMCGAPDFAKQAYAGGAPMGGDLPARPASATAGPTFAVAALRDPGAAGHPGTKLQRVQIVKGWVDDAGATHEKVYDVAGGPNAADVDTNTCQPTGTGGADQLCSVWTDPAFDARDHAFYYARVLENPSCRHSAYDCKAVAPDNRPNLCDNPAVLKTQERAWTSPIWYRP